VTELTQPLSDVSPVRQVQAQSRGTTRAHPPTFTELVYAHYEWWKAHEDGTLDRAGEAAYDSVLAAFEAEHGRLVRAYWCSQVESAVALTEKRGRLAGLCSPVYGFHRESDWATKSEPEVAAQLHRCDALAVRASAVLTGVRQRICLQLAVSCAANLLCLVDVRARSGDKSKTAAALEGEDAAIGKVESYYHNAANGQAQLVYFAGIATVTVALGALAAVWLSVSWASPVAALVAGSLGAVVSVVQRINSGKFELEYDVGGPYTFFLGGLRPLIGGVFAMAITFAFSSGLLQLPVASQETTDHRHLALLVLAFLAGFSERWAQDTLTAIVPVDQSKPAPGSGPPAGGQQQTGASDPAAGDTAPEKGAGRDEGT
jgi:hypothetical protein